MDDDEVLEVLRDSAYSRGYRKGLWTGIISTMIGMTLGRILFLFVY